MKKKGKKGGALHQGKSTPTQREAAEESKGGKGDMPYTGKSTASL